ncbi:hypothetical protein RchiOBHm_Chr1g0360771 [Rosa chinensis]|uniref:Uncharacterized protein n=1 Tax=Rosa chinensis TaxID=74649 RepID=A0A2P6SIQ3_ROSCH|nr:hypothetical protein RchiOBHm_Chr1g0360771 [Rosa chinensis]
MEALIVSSSLQATLGYLSTLVTSVRASVTHLTWRKQAGSEEEALIRIWVSWAAWEYLFHYQKKTLLLSTHLLSFGLYTIRFSK